MLPAGHKIAFIFFALISGAIALKGFHRAYRRIRSGREDAEPRFNRPLRRLWYALATTLTQRRTFFRRPVISFFHALIFYGFVFYLLVNSVDAIEGFFSFSIPSVNWVGISYNLLADLFSALVLIAVVALMLRRFLLPGRRDFNFNANTLLHEKITQRYIARDSLIVSLFILIHVGSRAIGAGARLALEGPDRFQPLATCISRLLAGSHPEAWRIFGYWGALGSILAFLAYFPYSKHIHLFMAPAKYLVARDAASGVLPPLDVNLDSEIEKLGARNLEDLSWPRLLDAYACIQCNRCQDVCPASATGKSLSPAALEINKRMELNTLASSCRDEVIANPRPLFSFALSPEAAWACTTCGACMQVCPVQNEQMLDIVDLRRNLVMIEGDFPAPLQNAFRGMERSSNPWGINHEQRMAWAEGLGVKTIDENPEPDVLYWVGCAASYDPQAQKTARAFVQILQHAGVSFAVLGKKECCTGDTARRAGNEFLYRELADKNVATLQAVKPKLIVATCPHCMNAIGNEYRQIGGNFNVVHHSEFLASLVAEGRIDPQPMLSSIAYHDPCYLGRHNHVYDAPRNLLRVLTNDFVELERSRENSFCCGAGGAQFWKEEESGVEKIAENRRREVEEKLDSRRESKVLAVGCPFCKGMLDSAASGPDSTKFAVKDVAELLLEGLSIHSPAKVSAADSTSPPLGTKENRASRSPEMPDLAPAESAPVAAPSSIPSLPHPETSVAPGSSRERKKWSPKNPASRNNS